MKQKLDLHRSTCLGPTTYEYTPPVCEAAQPGTAEASTSCQEPLYPAPVNCFLKMDAGSGSIR